MITPFPAIYWAIRLSAVRDSHVLYKATENRVITALAAFEIRCFRSCSLKFWGISINNCDTPAMFGISDPVVGIDSFSRKHNYIHFIRHRFAYWY